MMLMAASCPSNKLAAVTKRTLCLGLYWASAWNSADKSVIVVSDQAKCVKEKPFIVRLWRTG
jgi:hypothetical protein